jgi:hypothetical protein
VDFIAVQTSGDYIRLGVTTITFTTSGSPVTETLAEFSGSLHEFPGPYETATVGSFSIPGSAVSAVISGQFGNSISSASAGVNLCLGDGPCTGSVSTVSTVPLPAALPLFATGLGALGLLGWRRKRKAAAIAA